MFRLQDNVINTSRPYDHILDLEGTARIYTNKSDVAAFSDLACSTDQQLFSYAWMDEHGGVSGDLHFDKGDGHFQMDLPVQENEIDLMKQQIQWRNEDNISHNRRCFTFAAGAMVLPELLANGSVEYMLRDSVFKDNYVRMSLVLKNAEDFKNYKSNTNRNDLPLITFRPSALWDIQKSNSIMDSISATLKQCVDRNKISVTPSASAFLEGITK